MMLADKIDFTHYSTVSDIGGAKGNLVAILVARHPHLSGVTSDLPPCNPSQPTSSHRAVSTTGSHPSLGPSSQVTCRGRRRHDGERAPRLDLDTKEMLVSKAYDAVASGGIFIAIENVIDEERRNNAFGLLMSPNMAIETQGGFDYTGAQIDGWCTAAGFTHTEDVPLAGRASAVIAYKA